MAMRMSVANIGDNARLLLNDFMLIFTPIFSQVVFLIFHLGENAYKLCFFSGIYYVLRYVIFCFSAFLVFFAVLFEDFVPVVVIVL